MAHKIIAEMKGILDAIEQGKTVQWYDSATNTWRDFDINRGNPNFNFEHRIKPEEPKKLLTNRELAKWLAQGNGEVSRDTWNDKITNWNHRKEKENEVCDGDVKIRKWDDTEWHKPTREYAFGEEDA